MPLATKRAIPLGLCRAHAQPKDLGADGVKAASRRRRWRVAPALSPADHRSTSTQLLPGDEFFLVSVASRIGDASAPGWADAPPRDLTVATTARTTRFCRRHLRRPSRGSPFAHGLRLNPPPALRNASRADASPR